MVVYGQSFCFPAKVVVFVQKGFYWGKVVVFGRKRLYLGESHCIRVKVVIFG